MAQLSPDHSVSKSTAHEHLKQMLKADQELYERILDTPVFAYHFNQLVLLAERAPEPGFSPAELQLEAEARISHFTAVEGDIYQCQNCGKRKWQHASGVSGYLLCPRGL